MVLADLDPRTRVPAVPVPEDSVPIVLVNAGLDPAGLVPADVVPVGLDPAGLVTTVQLWSRFIWFISLKQVPRDQDHCVWIDPVCGSKEDHVHSQR